MDRNVEVLGKKREFFWFLGAFILAASLRFIALGHLPLGSGEADLAMQAFGLAKGNTPVISGAPSYVALTSLSFSIFQASGFWALFWPAVFGTAIIFTPLLFDGWLNRRASILLAFILAIDPGMVAVSRIAGSEMITLVSFVAAAGFLFKKRSIPAGVFAGLFILGGSASWPLLIVVAVIAFVSLFSTPKKGKERQALQGVNWLQFFISATASILLIGTVFLIHPTVITGIGTGFYQFFESFVSGMGISRKVMILSLPLYEFFILLLAIWAMIISIKHMDLVSELFGYAVLLFVLFFVFDASRQVTDWIWAILPLDVLAVRGLNDLLGRYVRKDIGVTAAQAVIAVALIVFSFLNLLLVINHPPADSVSLRNDLLEILLPLAFLIIVTLLLAFGWSPIAARQGVLMGIGALLLFITIGSAWKAAGLGPRPEMELFRKDLSPTGCSLLKKTTSQLSLMNTGIEDRIDVAILGTNTSDVLWCLHDYDRLSTAAFPGDADTSSIVITSGDSANTPAANYRGQAIHWTTTGNYDNMSAPDWLKWFISREAPAVTTNLYVWARDSLFTGK